MTNKEERIGLKSVIYNNGLLKNSMSVIYNNGLLPGYHFIKKHKKVISTVVIIGFTIFVTKKRVFARDEEWAHDLVRLERLLRQGYAKQYLKKNPLALLSRRKDFYKEVIADVDVLKFINRICLEYPKVTPAFFSKANPFFSGHTLRFGVGLTAAAFCYGYACMKVADYFDSL
jgi:hypothetical protein